MGLTLNDSARVIYVVTAFQHHIINSRMKCLVQLREIYSNLILVTVGDEYVDNENIRVMPYPNFTGLFRVLGLLKLRNYLDRYIYFPSPKILYVKAVLKKLIVKIKYDIENGKTVSLITTVPPHDLCIIGAQIKGKFPEVQWIIDWRDLWSFDESYFFKIPKIYRKKLLNLEREFFEKCDINVTTNSYAKEVLEKHFHVQPHRVVAINHHFNPHDFDGISGVNEYELGINIHRSIKIGVLGNIFKSPKVPGEMVVDLIRELRKSGMNVELHIYGDTSKSALRIAEASNVDGLYFHKRTTHKESLQNISGNDLLLILLGDLPNCRAIVPQKLTQYLLIGKPIIAIVPESSAVAKVIEDTGAGYIIPVDKDWDNRLAKVLEDFMAGRNLPTRNDEAISQFSINNVLKRWAELINSH